MTRALLLNASYEPHAVVRDRDAVVMLLQGLVEVEEISGEVFHSEHLDVLVPSVIRLKTYVVMPEKHRSVLLTTRAVLARDGHECGYCGLTGLVGGQGGNGTMDHVYPRSLGGKHVWANVTASCRKCNAIKKDLTLERMIEMGPDKPNVPGAYAEWNTRWTLSRVPFRPSGIAAYFLTAFGDAPVEWTPYLQMA
jgi:5-methylcytosine-specific restriction endonuclease McrA